MTENNNFSAADSTFVDAQRSTVRRLWLVRHGSTLWNEQHRMLGHSDIELSAQGEHQARRVGELLSRYRITAIYASDLLRAHRTADIIADQLAARLPVQLSAA